MMIVRSRMPGRLLKVMCCARVDQAIVDLVGDDQQVVALRHGGDLQHPLVVQHGAGGVVRVADQDGLGAAG